MVDAITKCMHVFLEMPLKCQLLHDNLHTMKNNIALFKTNILH